MRETIELDDELGQRLRAIAVRQGKRISDLLEDAARRMVAAAELPPIPVVHGTRPLSLDDLNDATREMEEAEGLRQVGLSDDTAA